MLKGSNAKLSYEQVLLRLSHSHAGSTIVVTMFLASLNTASDHDDPCITHKIDNMQGLLAQLVNASAYSSSMQVQMDRGDLLLSHC